MGKERSYDDRFFGKRQLEEYRALARSQEEEAEIDAWIDGLPKKEPVLEVDEAERHENRMKCKQIKKLYYGRLPAEQYEVYLYKEGYGMEYDKIAELTGNKQGPLRKNYHAAKKNIERMSRGSVL